MLIPTKHTNPDQTALYASVLILRRIMTQRIVKFDELKKLVSNQIVGGEFVFVPALSILFLLGKIQYHIKTDSIEYTEL